MKRCLQPVCPFISRELQHPEGYPAAAPCRLSGCSTLKVIRLQHPEGYPAAAPWRLSGCSRWTTDHNTLWCKRTRYPNSCRCAVCPCKCVQTDNDNLHGERNLSRCMALTQIVYKYVEHVEDDAAGAPSTVLAHRQQCCWHTATPLLAHRQQCWEMPTSAALLTHRSVVGAWQEQPQRMHSVHDARFRRDQRMHSVHEAQLGINKECTQCMRLSSGVTKACTQCMTLGSGVTKACTQCMRLSSGVTKECTQCMALSSGVTQTWQDTSDAHTAAVATMPSLQKWLLPGFPHSEGDASVTVYSTRLIPSFPNTAPRIPSSTPACVKQGSSALTPHT